MPTIPMCSQCESKIAISPEGLCNICDPKALSKRMKLEAQQEDNDLVYLGKARKMYRQERLETFVEFYEKLIVEPLITSITEHTIQGKFEIKTTTKYGIVDYYPKADKILIRYSNTWKTKGLNWIKKFLISE